MAVNPLGAVWVNDYGNPRVLSGYARETISGGQLVFASGASGTLTSGADSFSTSDVKFLTGASGANFVGVALQTTTSGLLVPVAVGGVFLLQAIGAVTAGTIVAAGGDDSVATSATAGQQMGRALTTAASGTFAAISIIG